jgi:hypothetical protein
MLHIELLDTMLVGLARMAELCHYDINYDKDYIDFVKDMTEMEIEGNITEFDMDFINRLLPIHNKLASLLAEQRQLRKVQITIKCKELGWL